MGIALQANKEKPDVMVNHCKLEVWIYASDYNVGEIVYGTINSMKKIISKTKIWRAYKLVLKKNHDTSAIKGFVTLELVYNQKILCYKSKTWKAYK